MVIRALHNNVTRINRTGKMLSVFAKGYVAAHRIGAFKQPNQPHHKRYIQIFCRNMCNALNVTVVAHGDMPQQHALWVSNHVSWVDILVIGSCSPAFYLSKIEVASYPIIGPLAKAAGTLFIRRGSGDAGSVREQIAAFLADDTPVIFFPEATTTDGVGVKKLHGKLLQAAIDTGVPVQPLVVCYVNHKGELDDTLPFIGQISFPTHLVKVLAHPAVTAHIMPLAAIDPVGHSMASLTEQLTNAMRTGLIDLHQRALLGIG